MASGVAPPDIPGYLMEGADESERLRLKDRTEATAVQLEATGFADLGPRPHIVDAGTGVGVVAAQMAELATARYPGAQLTLLDGSARRLDAARANLSAYTDITQSYLACDLEGIPLPDDSVDYLFCRFVFEYLAHPQKVFSEFDRIVKPGGRLVVGDLDHNALNHYPLSASLQSRLDELVHEVERAAVFDFYAGRKLYAYFHRAGYHEVSVQMYAHHLFYGSLSPADEYNWTAKLDRLMAFQRDGVLRLSFDLGQFREEFLEFLRSPERFSYTPLLLVAGTKP